MMLKWQVGVFFVILGFLALIIFFISGEESSPLYAYFCSSVLLLGLGVVFMWTGRNPAPSSERFSLLRRFSKKGGKKEKKEGEKTED